MVHWGAAVDHTVGRERKWGADVDGGDIRRARLACGWSQTRLAEALNHAAGHPTLDGHYVSRWERGVRRPDAFWLPHLRRVLNLVTQDDPPVLMDTGIDLKGSEEDMRRRTLLAAAGGAVAGNVLDALGPVRQRLEGSLRAPITEHDVAEWERAADQYARLAGQVPAEPLLVELLADLDDVRDHLDRAPDVLRPRLLRVCALFGGLAAIALLSGGRWGDAGRYWRLADRAARLSGDRAAGCLIGGRRAVLGLYAPGSSPRVVLAIADDVVAASAGTPNAGTMSALAARAQVLALVGDKRGAYTALADLESTFERLDDTVTSERSTEWYWPENRLRHVRSFVHSHSGSFREAVASQDAAFALCDDPTSLGTAQLRLHRAMSVIVSGDPSEGVRYVSEVLESVPPAFRGGFVGTTAEQALNVLPRRASALPAVRQARELISSGGTV